MILDKNLIADAKLKEKTVVFPEASFSERVVKAGLILAKKKICKVIFLADESALLLRYKKLKNVTIISPTASELKQDFALALYENRKSKGMTMSEAEKLIEDPFYFASILVSKGFADAVVGGAEVSTAQNLRPALQIIKSKDEIASSCFLFLGKHKNIKTPIFLADAATCPNPNSEQLALIASQTKDTMKMLFPNIEPRIAFLSYSTKSSASGEMVDKMINAKNLFANANPTVLCDGELQLDSAISQRIMKIKCPNSVIEGEANILITPDLNSGNILYKAIQYFGNLTAIGPIMQGMNKPVNDLSRGCTINDIILLTVITILQCGK